MGRPGLLFRRSVALCSSSHRHRPRRSLLVPPFHFHFLVLRERRERAATIDGVQRVSSWTVFVPHITPTPPSVISATPRMRKIWEDVFRRARRTTRWWRWSQRVPCGTSPVGLCRTPNTHTRVGERSFSSSSFFLLFRWVFRFGLVGQWKYNTHFFSFCGRRKWWWSLWQRGLRGRGGGGGRSGFLVSCGMCILLLHLLFAFYTSSSSNTGVHRVPMWFWFWFISIIKAPSLSFWPHTSPSPKEHH